MVIKLNEEIKDEKEEINRREGRWRERECKAFEREQLCQYNIEGDGWILVLAGPSNLYIIDTYLPVRKDDDGGV